MTSISIDSKERVDAAWGNYGAGSVARHAEAKNAPVVESTPAPKNSLFRAGMRFVRNAMIGLALIVAVPLVVIARNGPGIIVADWDSMSRRMTDIERMRPYAIRELAVEKDESITPLEAGRALHALQSGKASDVYPMHAVANAPVRPWKTVAMSPGMFGNIGQDFTQRQAHRIIAAARDGFSAEELAWARTVAEAPIWKDFDVVARAPAVDVIGAKYRLPFTADANVVSMPSPRFADTKELAAAGVVRAAYHMAAGDHDRAEYVLRTVVSFGFSYIDNATTAMDAFVGRSIVEIGRDGLEQFFMATGRTIEHADALQRVTFAPIRPSTGPRPDWRTIRAQLLASAANPELSRGLRLESLQGLSFGVCTNLAEVLTGHSDEVSDAYKAARTSLARYASEQAYLDLMMQSPNRVPPYLKGSLSDRLVSGAGEIAATVLRNPRISGCTRLALAHSG